MQRWQVRKTRDASEVSVFSHGLWPTSEPGARAGGVLELLAVLLLEDLHEVLHHT